MQKAFAKLFLDKIGINNLEEPSKTKKCKIHFVNKLITDFSNIVRS